MHEMEERVLEELPGVVDDGAFAPCPLPGIDPEHDAATERRGEEQLAEVLGEDADGVAVGP